MNWRFPFKNGLKENSESESEYILGKYNEKWTKSLMEWN